MLAGATASSPTTTAALDAARLRVVLLTVLVNITGVTLLTLAPWSDWRTGVALNVIDNALLVGFALRWRDRFLGHLIGFGLAVGFTELVADAWLVDYTHTLDYSVGGGPMLWRSPAWMPFAWEIVAVQFAVLGERLMRWRPGAGLLLTALLGAVNIPYYEEMARRIHWWRYSGCRMISGTPYYIIVGELLIAAGFALLVPWVRRGQAGVTLAAGVVGGALIFVAYAAAFLLTDRLF